MSVLCIDRMTSVPPASTAVPVQTLTGVHSRSRRHGLVILGTEFFAFTAVSRMV